MIFKFKCHLSIAPTAKRGPHLHHKAYGIQFAINAGKPTSKVHTAYAHTHPADVLFVRRLVGYRVCDKLFGLLVGAGSKTHRHLRQAIEPSSQPPFQVEAFTKRRADEKGPADKYLNKDQFDQQDWWGAVCQPSNNKQEKFISSFGIT